MRPVWLAGILVLAACVPPPGDATPVSGALEPFRTGTPSATALQPQGLVISFETPLPSPTPFTYTVKAGDTMGQIAQSFNITLDVLLAANPNVDPSNMSIGQALIIPGSSPNPAAESTPTPVPFQIRQIVCYPTSDRGMWCFALAHNDSSDFMEDVTARVNLLDADGKTIAGQTALLPLNLLPPNSSLPLFTYFAPEVPSDAQAQVQVLTAIRLLPGDARYLPATLQNTLVQVDWSGLSAQVSGEVFLPASSKPAGLIWVAAVAYDDAGRVVGVRRWESTARLTTGGSLPFAFAVSSLAGTITRVDFAVEARP